MIPGEDPLDPMITRLRTGRELPFDWVIEHAGDGDVVAATARLYATSVRALPELAFHAGIDTMVFARATIAAVVACTERGQPSRAVRRDYVSRLQRWAAAPDYPALVARARELTPGKPDFSTSHWDEIVKQLFDAAVMFAERRARGEMSYIVEKCLPEQTVADAFRSVATPAMIGQLVRRRLVPYGLEDDRVEP